MENILSQHNLKNRKSSQRRMRPIEIIHSMLPMLPITALLAILFLLTACSEDFAPFNTVEKFRALSLKADPPALAEGETAVVTPLLYVPEDDFEGISYKWSWCPIAVNSAKGGECAISEEMFKGIAEEMIRQSTDADISELLEGLPLSFDLGTDPTATFVYAIPADLLLQVCENLLAQDIPTNIGIPDCRDKLDVIIRLEASYKSESLIALKTVPLYIDEERADNENPAVDGISIRDKDGDAVEVEGDLPVLYRGESYDITADIDDGASQLFTPAASSSNPAPEPVREYLFMTWYGTGGTTESARTTFIDGEVPMGTLRNNSWNIPQSVDYPSSEITLYLVLQDERGGTGWFEKRFAIEER